MLASWSQPRSEVWRRESGSTLKPWKSVSGAAELHWPFAWASVAAYQNALDPKQKPLPTGITCPEPDAYLGSRGWSLWKTLPAAIAQPDERDGVAGAAMRAAHLRAQVWSNQRRKQVIVAFGGTVATYPEDWRANARWALGPLRRGDQYCVLIRVFVPLFITEFARQAALPNGEWLLEAQVIATGHSLGGGLAQCFAYALSPGPAYPRAPRVKQVYAFDPSPVTAKRDVPDFAAQANSLCIDRIYNRGEVLASLRSVLRLGNPGNERNQGQTWTDFRYIDDWSFKTLLPSGSVHAHSMYTLACFMKDHMDQALD